MTRAQRIRLFLGIMRLGERRNPASGSRWSKVLEWFGAALACLYLSACGVGLGFLAKDIGPYTIVGVMPFVLIVDFSMRFASRKKPIDITPYLILPVKRSEVIDSLLLSSLAAGYNFVWLCLFLPHCITVAAMGVATLPEAAGIALVCQFLIETNCLWQLLVRSLTNKSLAWWALPAMAYAMPMAAAGMASASDAPEAILDFFVAHGHTPVSILAYMACFAMLFVANRHVLLCSAMQEATGDGTKRKAATKITLPEKWGITGEYMKLEIKSTMRNKAIKRNFMQGILLMSLLSAMITFTTIYDNDSFSQTTYCFYCFIFFGIVNLTRIMGAEGNYIDMLMTHKESTYQLLKAKYYYYCMVLAVPLAILLPAMISGKLPPSLVFAGLFTTTGPIYFILFQLAVNNRQTMPLNNTAIGRPGSNNAIPAMIGIVSFIAPVAAIQLIALAVGKETSLLIMTVVGLVFTVTHKLWLHNIYARMMRKKHTNLEGFHATR